VSPGQAKRQAQASADGTVKSLVSLRSRWYAPLRHNAAALPLRRTVVLRQACPRDPLSHRRVEMHCPELTFQILHVRSIDPVKHKLPVKSNCVDEISPRWPASVWMHLHSRACAGSAVTPCSLSHCRQRYNAHCDHSGATLCSADTAAHTSHPASAPRAVSLGDAETKAKAGAAVTACRIESNRCRQPRRPDGFSLCDST
jgi:hypothetical protein